MSMGATDTEKTVEPEEEWEARTLLKYAKALLHFCRPLQHVSLKELCGSYSMGLSGGLVRMSSDYYI